MFSLVLIGSGGHASSVMDVISRIKKIKIIGYVDKKENNFIDLNYLGSDENLNQIFGKCNKAHISIGHVKSNSVRKRLFYKLKKIGFQFPIIKSSSAIISKNSELQEGSIIMENVILNHGSKIGYNCIINNKALIEHDSVIGNNCHISTGALINGNVKIGDDVFIGSGSIINNNISIGKKCFINSGKTINRNLLDYEIIK